MPPLKPKNCVQIRHAVQDEEKTAVYARTGTAPAGEPFQGNIFLVGLRASGKTTLGRLVAQRLGRVFVDTDRLVVEQAGMTIAELVREQGWEAFRDLECRVLRDVCSRSGQVVATGGGIVLRQENREALCRSGKVFYLLADPATLALRLERDPEEQQRPALTDLDLRQELAATLGEREPLYMGVASFILQAGQEPDELAQDVVDKLAL